MFVLLCIHPPQPDQRRRSRLYTCEVRQRGAAEVAEAGTVPSPHATAFSPNAAGCLRGDLCLTLCLCHNTVRDRERRPRDSVRAHANPHLRGRRDDRCLPRSGPAGREASCGLRPLPRQTLRDGRRRRMGAAVRVDGVGQSLGRGPWSQSCLRPRVGVAGSQQATLIRQSECAVCYVCVLLRATPPLTTSPLTASPPRPIHLPPSPSPRQSPRLPHTAHGHRSYTEKQAGAPSSKCHISKVAALVDPAPQLNTEREKHSWRRVTARSCGQSPSAPPPTAASAARSHWTRRTPDRRAARRCKGAPRWASSGGPTWRGAWRQRTATRRRRGRGSRARRAG